MKIIELLNKIANGEEVPKKIRYKTFEMKRTKSEEVKRLYVDEQGCFFPEYYIFDLNDEVEILEEEKKILEKLNLDTDELRGKETPRAIDYLIEDKINEVIDYLKSKGE